MLLVKINHGEAIRSRESEMPLTNVDAVEIRRYLPTCRRADVPHDGRSARQRSAATARPSPLRTALRPSLEGRGLEPAQTALTARLPVTPSFGRRVRDALTNPKDASIDC